jgi:hypothetical protein
MNLVPRFSWLAKLGWRLPRAAARPDFADMGTAFGLDASLASSFAPSAVMTGKKKGRSPKEAPRLPAAPARSRKPR